MGNIGDSKIGNCLVSGILKQNGSVRIPGLKHETFFYG